MSGEHGQRNQLSMNLGSLQGLVKDIQSSCSTISAVHGDVCWAGPGQSGSSQYMQVCGDALESQLECYDETTSLVFSHIAGLDTLVSQLPAMVALQKEELSRLSAWENKQASMSALYTEHIAEVEEAAAAVAAARSRAVQLRSLADEEAEALAKEQSAYAAMQVQRAKDIQVGRLRSATRSCNLSRWLAVVDLACPSCAGVF
jgi:DNA repair ATPase RecN